MEPVIEVDDNERVAVIRNGDDTTTLRGTHRKGECAGPVCALHGPSDHHLRDRPLKWHVDGFFYRICEHDEWVYDPDQLSYWWVTYVNPAVRAREKSPCLCGFSVPRSRGACRKCGDCIESLHRHDYVTCECGKSFVDGGSVYFRGGGYLG